MGGDVQLKGNIFEFRGYCAFRGEFTHRYALALQNLCLPVIYCQYFRVRDDLQVPHRLYCRKLHVESDGVLRINNPESKS